MVSLANAPMCPKCGLKMVRKRNMITGEYEPNIWRTTCGHYEDSELHTD